MAVSKPFKNHSDPVLDDLRSAASGFTADESLEEPGAGAALAACDGPMDPGQIQLPQILRLSLIWNRA